MKTLRGGTKSERDDTERERYADSPRKGSLTSARC